MGTVTLWCDGGPADGDQVLVDVEERTLPPLYIARPVLALDEATETAWWVRVRYARAPFWKIPRPGEPWRYFHSPPVLTRTEPA